MKEQKQEWWVEVVNIAQQTIIKRFGPYTIEKMAEKTESGVIRNLNADEYCTRIVGGVL